jgi:uncharacterized protein
MKTLLLLAILSIPFMFKSPAKTKHESIKNLIVVMKVDSIASSALRQAIIHQINRRNLPRKDTSQIKEFVKIEEQDMSNKLIYHDILAFYDKNFTSNEIMDLLKFYKSPAGQKALKLFPNIEIVIWDILKKDYIPELIDKADNLEKRIKK